MPVKIAHAQLGTERTRLLSGRFNVVVIGEPIAFYSTDSGSSRTLFAGVGLGG